MLIYIGSVLENVLSNKTAVLSLGAIGPMSLRQYAIIFVT